MMTKTQIRTVLRFEVVGCLLAASFAVSVMAADPREEFKQAVEAVEAGQHGRAIPLLRSAIGQRSEERIGTFRKYLPHYYLGIALSEEGDCEGALRALAESARQGQIKKSVKEYTDLQERKRRCEGLISSVESKVRDVESVLDKARQAAEGITSLSKTPELAVIWSAESPSLAGRQEAANDLLRQAQQTMRDGETRKEVATLERAEQLAEQAIDAFAAVDAAARRKLAELDAATANALEQLERTEESAENVMASISDLAPYPAQLGRYAATLREDLDEVAQAKSRAKPAELDAFKDQLTISMSRLRRAAERPPEALRNAAEAYLTSAFEEVLTTLEEASFKEARAQAHARLLRSAAWYGRYVMEGEQDGTTLDRAVQEIEAGATIEPRLEPHPRFFSPRFLAFYQSVLDDMAAREAAAEGEGEDDPSAE